MKKLHISTGSGKMAGIPSINTPTSTNKFCQKMAKTNSVCAKCYAKRFESMRLNVLKAISRNVPVLMDKDFQPPKLNYDIVRFHSFGELINRTHLNNFFKIAFANPNTFFGLWTKRKDLVQAYIREGGVVPSNMNLIYSNPKMDSRLTKVPKGFHKVFNVHSKEGIELNEIPVNCGGKSCINCKLCYTKNSVQIIDEKLH